MFSNTEFLEICSGLLAGEINIGNETANFDELLKYVKAKLSTFIYRKVNSDRFNFGWRRINKHASMLQTYPIYFTNLKIPVQMTTCINGMT